ncbi:hypothetical protein K488DRAFT_86981 [Vararia minispora EC-137]|uniref:Uncharacterized protein n=1 Tax=Vararia minispora EC-137 TaxID=1314806 RepID=A0ACB8QHS0_9AGAM|nr:hypothetical protein K488DRAFT_86981 [Vararia minispora EC-137]
MVRTTNSPELADTTGFSSNAFNAARPFPPSEISMSFQIPCDAGSTTRLLDVDSSSLLDGLDDSFGTPKLPVRVPQPPLTLEELTPRKQLKQNLRDVLSKGDQSALEKSVPVEAHALKSTSGTVAYDVPRSGKLPIAQSSALGDPGSLPPVTLPSKKTATLSSTKPAALPPISSTRRADETGPLTFLELSPPRKPALTIAPPFTREPTKQPGADSLMKDVGRGSFHEPSAEAQRGATTRKPSGVTKNTRPPPANAHAPDSPPGPDPSQPGPSVQRQTKRIVSKLHIKKGVPRRRSSIQRAYCVPAVAAKHSGPSSSMLYARRRAGLLERGQKAGANCQELGLMSSKDKRPTSTQRPQLTKPIEFHFQAEARLEARKHQGESEAASEAWKRRDPSIPDFKSLHAVEEERSLARKTLIAPTVPQPPKFELDTRLRDREKFETGRRAREMELERQREETRLLREREEEEEIRRLRKQAVPRANPVPEWYAHAPKRSGRSASSSTSSRGA